MFSRGNGNGQIKTKWYKMKPKIKGSEMIKTHL